MDFAGNVEKAISLLIEWEEKQKASLPPSSAAPASVAVPVAVPVPSPVPVALPALSAASLPIAGETPKESEST